MNSSTHLNPEGNTVLLVSSGEMDDDGESARSAGSASLTAKSHSTGAGIERARGNTPKSVTLEASIRKGLEQAQAQEFDTLFVLESVHEFGGRASAEESCFSPDGRHVFVVGETNRVGDENGEGFIMLIGRGGIKWRKTFVHPGYELINCIQFNGDGKILVITTDESQCLFINSEDGQTIFTFRCHREADGHRPSVEKVAFSRSGNRIALSTSNGKLIVLDSSLLMTRRKKGTYMLEDDGRYVVAHLSFHPCIDTLNFCDDDSKLLLTHSEGTIELWKMDDAISLASSTKTAAVTEENILLCEVVYVHYNDEDHVLLGQGFNLDGDVDGTPFFADPNTGKMLGTAVAGPPFCDLHPQCISGDILVGQLGDVVRVWDACTQKRLQTIRCRTWKFRSASISGDGSRICLLTRSALTMLSRRPVGSCKTLFQTRKGLVSTSLSLDGSRILVADISGIAWLLATWGRGTKGRRKTKTNGRRKKEKQSK